MNARVIVGLFGLSALLVIGVSGCTTGAPSPSPDATHTRPVATQSPAPTPTNRVQLTIPSASNTPIQTTPTLTPGLPSPTIEISPSPTIPCDQAGAGYPIDITIPDNTILAPGQIFTKIWQLQNTGTCMWTTAYAARFFYGTQMEAPDLVFLSREVPPGGIIEIAIDMVAPLQPGTYQGNWKLRNADGALFGIGPRGDSPFWVRIEVSQPETTTPTIAPTQAPSPTSTETPTPSASPTITPEVLSSGALTLELNDNLDLDVGLVNSLSDEDIHYRLDASGFHLLIPLNNAQMGIIGTSEPDPDKCRSANMSTAPLTLESLPAQMYLCYKTNLNRLGWLRYEGLSENGEQVNLFFWTWLQP